MMGMTIAALVLQIAGATDGVLAGVAILLLALALWITGEAVLSLLKRRSPSQGAPEVP